MTSPFNADKSHSSEFPNHSGNLIFVLMHSWNPPLSPWLQYRPSFILFHSAEPIQSSNYRNIRINITRINPNSDSFSHQSRINDLTAIFIHFVVMPNQIAAKIEFNRINMEVLVNCRLIEEMLNTNYIVTSCECVWNWCEFC